VILIWPWNQGGQTNCILLYPPLNPITFVWNIFPYLLYISRYLGMKVKMGIQSYKKVETLDYLGKMFSEKIFHTKDVGHQVIYSQVWYSQDCSRSSKHHAMMCNLYLQLFFFPEISSFRDNLVSRSFCYPILLYTIYVFLFTISYKNNFYTQNDKNGIGEISQKQCIFEKNVLYKSFRI